jgi:uncharacterized protein
VHDAAASAACRRIGLVSDTHGKLDPRVAVALADVDRIIHSGDIGAPDVLHELELIAPVTAILGNVDRWVGPADALQHIARIEELGVRIVVVHDRLDLLPVDRARADVIVFGHSHMPHVDFVDGVLWVNPGSASQARRSQIGRSVAVLTITADAHTNASIVPLNDFGEQK